MLHLGLGLGFLSTRWVLGIMQEFSNFSRVKQYIRRELWQNVSVERKTGRQRVRRFRDEAVWKGDERRSKLTSLNADMSISAASLSLNRTNWLCFKLFLQQPSNCAKCWDGQSSANIFLVNDCGMKSSARQSSKQITDTMITCKILIH